MRIMLPGTVKEMSTIIAVCSGNFCLMAADSRMVVNSDNAGWEVYSDDAKKIFKIGNVLFGVIGKLWKDEVMTAPFVGYNNMNIYNALDILEKYAMDNILHIYDYPRNYILCGQESDGKYIIVVLKFNAEKHGFDREVYRPPEEYDKAYVLALPPSLADRMEYFNKLLEREINASKSTDEMKNRLTNLIRKIGKEDVQHTVGGKIQCIVI